MPPKSLLTPEEFDNALRKGLGRAVGHVRAAPPESVREQLLHACVNYLGYDLQCEGSRAPWLYEMISITGEPDWYCAELLKALEAVQELSVESGLCEMISLLAVFVRNGRADVRDILLRKVFGFDMSDDGDVIADVLPAGVLGVDGVVEVLRRYSRRSGWCLSLGARLLGDAVKIFGQSMTDAVRAAGRGDETLRAHLREIEEERRAEEGEKPEWPASPPELPNNNRPSEEELFALLDNLPPENDFLNDSPPGREMWKLREEYAYLCHRFRLLSTSKNRKRVAPPGFLKRVFARLTAEKDSGRQYCLLGAFAHAAMPRFEADILKLVDSPVEALSCGAAQAFSNMPDPEVRAKGRELLEARSKHGYWLNGFLLLTASERPEDVPLIVEALGAVPVNSMDVADLHSLASDVIPLADIGEPAASAPIMLWVYENTPCANCRNAGVAWLVKNHVAPGEMLAECLEDCDESIRRAARPKKSAGHRPSGAS